MALFVEQPLTKAVGLLIIMYNPSVPLYCWKGLNGELCLMTYAQKNNILSFFCNFFLCIFYLLFEEEKNQPPAPQIKRYF